MTRIMFLAVLMLLFRSIPLSAQVWEKEIDEDGILVKIGMDTVSGYPLFEAETEMNFSPEEIYKALSKYDSLENWVYGVSESHLVGSKDSMDIVYYRLDLPWPARDRDVVVSQKALLTETGIYLEVEGVESSYQPFEGLSRISMLHTRWNLYRTKENGTKIIYRSAAETQGIPNWIVKLFLATNPRETLKNLRELNVD